MAKLLLLLFFTLNFAKYVFSISTLHLLTLNPNSKFVAFGNKEHYQKRSITLKQPQIYQMHVTSTVSNRFASTTVISKVRNLEKVSQESTFSVIIPDTAFISGFVMEVNGKNYTAYVKEKEEAKKKYYKAIESGQGAAHVAVSARDSNRFTVSVNVEAETKATFYLSYEELLIRQTNHYELIINLHAGQPVSDLAVEVAINESRKIVKLKVPPVRSGNEISSDAPELDPGADIKIIDENTATVKFNPNLERQKTLATLLGDNGDHGLSGQFVVQYDVERDPTGGEVILKDGYFVHFFAPSELKPIPKHIVFVLDTSSSMYGQKIDQLREAMLHILEQLNEQDKFNLVEFNSHVKVWDLFEHKGSVQFPIEDNDYSRNNDPDVTKVDFPKACQVNAETIEKAKEAVLSLTAVGSTDIYNALKVSLHLVELVKRKESSYQPLIIFLTDGDPTVGITSTELIITKISEYNSGLRRSAIFTLTFGEDADIDFLKSVAAQNLGFSRHIYEAADASLQLQNFYKQISSPLLANVTFKYGSTATKLTKTNFPIHFEGSEIVVAGFCGTPNFVPPAVDGLGDRGWIRLRPNVRRSVSRTERLWAYVTIKQLLEEKEISEKKQAEFRKKALELSLKYEFVTPLSSLVVVKPNATDDLQLEAADKSNFDSNKMHIPTHYSLGPKTSTAVFVDSREFEKKTRSPYSKKIRHDSNVTDNTKQTSLVVPVFTHNASGSNIFNSIPWLKNILVDGVLRLTTGNYKLGLNETISDSDACTKNPFDDSTGYCSLLNSCKHVLHTLKSQEVFEQYFCVLRKEYAGICCPDLP